MIPRPHTHYEFLNLYFGLIALFDKGWFVASFLRYFSVDSLHIQLLIQVACCGCLTFYFLLFGFHSSVRAIKQKSVSVPMRV